MLVMNLHEGEVASMKAVKAVYENGQLKLSEPAPEDGPVEVLVVFPKNGDEAWEKITGITGHCELRGSSQWLLIGPHSCDDFVDVRPGSPAPPPAASDSWHRTT